MSTSQVDFYTNRVGKFEKMRRDGQTKPGSDKTNAHLWHIYSRTPTHKLITVHLRRTVTNVNSKLFRPRGKYYARFGCGAEEMALAKTHPRCVFGS